MKATHSTETDSPGIGSLQGIRWLLAVGALVLVVSVYRLVESQWNGMSVTAQFLAMVAGTFGVFGAGELLRNRLRLPMAGSALQLLFSVLVPVLSWGAAYLNLLSTAGGAIVYAVSILALLGAFRRCLGSSLRYDGVLYPFAFGLLTVSLPLLSRVEATAWGHLLATIGLGAVFHGGSRHINRFLFHRDRRDGIDRPVTVLPFVTLALLYAASLSVSKIPVTHVALALAIGGATLVFTGEEYYSALVRSLRARPDRWPRRSVWLLVVGFSLLAVAGPLALLDASGRVPAIVLCGMGALLLRWGFRYESVPAHALGMSALVVGYGFLPALMPRAAVEQILSLTDLLGLVAPTAKISFGQLGLALLFTLLGRHRAMRAHAIGAAVHSIGIVALSAFGGAKIVAPLALALALLSVAMNRRREWLVAAQAALGASIIAWGGSWGMELLAVVMIAVVMTPVIGLGRGSRYLIGPVWFWAGVVTISGVVSFTSGGALELLAAGVLLLVLGERLAFSPAIAAGLGLSSLGIHGELALRHGAPMVWIVAATQLLFAGSVVVLRRANETWELGAQVSTLGHGVLGMAWLFVAFGTSAIDVTIEPVILALFGWAISWNGLRDEDETEAAIGIGLLAVYVPVHLAALGLVETVPVLLLLALGSLVAARALAPRWLRPGIEGVMRFWRVIAVVVTLTLAGVEAAALALSVFLTVALVGKIPFRSLLLVLAHGLILSRGGGVGGLFPHELAEAVTSAFPWFAALALGWIVLVETHGERALSTWATVLECLAVPGYFLGLLSGTVFTAGELLALAVIALAFATRHSIRSFQSQNPGHAWAMQAWLTLGGLVGHYVGWVRFGDGRAPYELLAAGVLQYVVARLWKRSTHGHALAEASNVTGQALALLGGVVALARLQAWPLFLASLFYLFLASRETKRVAPAILSAGFLGLALFAIASSHGVGLELYSLAPGLALLALAVLLSEEMGPRWSGHVFAAGAAFIYATPVLALYDEITWAWQAVLLLLTVGFGSASFWLRSRPLLTISTAALVIDLACFVIMIRATEPLLLWVGGIGLGVALMSSAAYLEHRREGLAQRIRVFGRALAGWY